jgi:ribose transport system permease protein/ribose transport system ATP-binding protein
MTARDNGSVADPGTPTSSASQGLRALALPAARTSISAPGESTSRVGLAAVAALLVVFFSLRHDTFFTSDNATTIAVNMSSITIAVIGTALLLTAGHVDLSIGSMYGLVGMIVAEVAVKTGSTVAAVAAGLVSGLVMGMLNATLVRLLRISPLIVTIGMLAVYRGLAFVVSTVSVYGFPQSFVDIGRGEIASIPYVVIIALVVFVAVGFALTRTVTGLRIYAIGGDAKAAERAGVQVSRTVFGLYAFNGLLIGLVAVLTTARLGSGTPGLGAQFEFDVLTAAILGGVAFTGGAGRPLGVLIGVATIGIVNAGLVFEGLADQWQQIAKGAILLLALAADQIAAARRRRRAVRQGGAGSADAEPYAVGARVAREAPRGPTELSAEAVLSVEHASKAYGAVRALEDGTLRVRAGEIVCLLGDNGAGKSTLAKIIAGAERPDGGEIHLDGQRVNFHSPADARAAGIETVYQDLALCPNLSVAHNLVLGNEPTRRVFGVVRVRDDKRASELATHRLADLGIRLRDESVLVQSLSGGQRQSVAIARALGHHVKVILLDEPTAALGVTQTANVLALVKSIAAQGTAVIMITHDVASVLQTADRVVVLRSGQVIHDGSVGEQLTEHQLLRLMAGLDHIADTTLA